MASKNKKAVKAEPESVFVYLGPSIRGVIQNGSIYRGTRTEVVESLKAAIEVYPKIERLLFGDVEIAAAKEKLRNGGNALSLAYQSLLAK